MEHREVIAAERLAIGYHQGKHSHPLHRALNFTLREGELTALLGPNGAGKSTLLRTLSGYATPWEGGLTLYGKPMACYSMEERARRIGVVLTDATYAGGLRVRELVALGRHPYTGFFGRLTTQDSRRVEEAMEAVGISDKAECYMAELSDGERQKVMIAKVLTQECPVILLDEPTAFLDVISRIEVMQLLHRLSREQHKCILLSTHDLEQAFQLSDRIWMLSQQEGMCTGVTEDLLWQGAPDRFFGRNGIQFDLRYGSFRWPASSGHPIRLLADNPMLEQWSGNALRRNGWRVTEEPCPLSLCVERPDRAIIRYRQEAEMVCSSFEAWIRQLEPYKAFL